MQMLKPDFGAVGRRIDWHDERVAWGRHLAEDKPMTAREIAADIGLAATQSRAFLNCASAAISTCSDRADDRGRKVKRAFIASAFRVAIPAFSRLAARHSLDEGRIAERILNAALETGEPLCENLLDLEIEQGRRANGVSACNLDTVAADDFGESEFTHVPGTDCLLWACRTMTFQNAMRSFGPMSSMHRFWDRRARRDITTTTRSFLPAVTSISRRGSGTATISSMIRTRRTSADAPSEATPCPRSGPFRSGVSGCLRRHR
ncbi:hypothetical protein [Bradyrhizobium glycinis]|uniref:hypothetical protein n=1 Tax=Bradyrhizobium glycinis TaxID=2751812 RepID=UPI0018D7DF8D|nr:hypothetical protein [Bradyrhizobium glycinis]MBH5370959.1 hypothetical protein [Bradyrhizobium glycinis]